MASLSIYRKFNTEPVLLLLSVIFFIGGAISMNGTPAIGALAIILGIGYYRKKKARISSKSLLNQDEKIGEILVSNSSVRHKGFAVTSADTNIGRLILLPDKLVFTSLNEEKITLEISKNNLRSFRIEEPQKIMGMPLARKLDRLFIEYSEGKETKDVHFDLPDSINIGGYENFYNIPIGAEEITPATKRADFFDLLKK